MEKILVLDLGGRFAYLAAACVRENRVFSEIHPYNMPIEDIKKENYSGIILAGGEGLYWDENLPLSRELFELGLPVLAVGNSAVTLAQLMGGTVEKKGGDCGKIETAVDTGSRLFENTDKRIFGFSDYTYAITRPPIDFKITAKTLKNPIAAIENTAKRIFAVQLHPEVRETSQGKEIIRSFLFSVCGCKGEWIMSAFARETVKALRAQIGEQRVVMGLSGGTQATVAAALLGKAIEKNLTCIFIDHGLLRKNEARIVSEMLKENYKINVILVDARDRFLGQLKGIEDPTQKRTIIEREFNRIFEVEAKKLGGDRINVSCSLYSGQAFGEVGSVEGILAPLSILFESEVAAVGDALKMPPETVHRQPIPTTGLGTRIIGDITLQKLEILQNADAIFREEVQRAGLIGQTDRYFAELSDMGEGGYTVILRAATVDDFGTATWSQMPYAVLDSTSHRISAEIKGINRVVYDVTSKPTATIEWE